MQKGGQGIARRRDAALHQNAPDRPPVIAAVGHQVQQHLGAAHLPLVAIRELKPDLGVARLRAQGRHILHQPVIQCRDRAVQRRQGRRLGGIGGGKAVGLPQQIGLEDGIDHMDMVEDAQGRVVSLAILHGIQGGEGRQQFVIGPALVMKKGLQRLVVHRFLAFICSLKGGHGSQEETDMKPVLRRYRQQAGCCKYAVSRAPWACQLMIRSRSGR